MVILNALAQQGRALGAIELKLICFAALDRLGLKFLKMIEPRLLALGPLTIAPVRTSYRL